MGASRRRAGRLLLSAFASVLALGAVCGATASATTLTVGGATVANGSVVGGSLAGTALINTTSSGSARCTRGIFSGTVGNNGSATVGLSSAVFSYNTCTDTITAFNLEGCTLSSAVSMGIASAGSSGGTVSGTTVVWRCTLRAGGIPASCTLTANALSGSYTNSDASSTFTNVPISSATGVCGTVLPATFTAKYGPWVASGYSGNMRVDP